MDSDDGANKYDSGPFYAEWSEKHRCWFIVLGDQRYPVVACTEKEDAVTKTNMINKIVCEWFGF